MTNNKKMHKALSFNGVIIKQFIGLMVLLGFSYMSQAHEYQVYKDIQWASPNGQPLTLDIYVPKTGKKSYPVLVIYHGGGWLINDKSPMTAMSEYLSSHGEVVVANMNYRLLPDNNNTVTLNQIVEDVFGGLLWVKDHIANYSGDASKIAVTGDSAGGHLAAMILLRGRQLESDGFKGDSLGFNPTYLPKGETAEQVAARDGLKVQAGIISYGAFDLYDTARGGFEKPSNFFWQIAKTEPRGMFGDTINVDKHPEYYQAVSPIYHIPKAKDYLLPPQFVHVGSEDGLTTPMTVGQYVESLKKAGQTVTYKIYPGLNHAFLDGGCNQQLNSCIEQNAPAVLDDMLAFLNTVFK